MRSEFDGLRAILGNETAVSLSDAPAVEPPPAAPVPVAVSAVPATVEAAAAPAEHVGSHEQAAAPSSRDELSDIPDLAELDRGLFSGDGVAARADESSSLDALDAGLQGRSHEDELTLDDLDADAAPPATSNAPLVGDDTALQVDDGVFAGAALRTKPRAIGRAAGAVASARASAADRRVSGWAAVAVMVFGLVLGATAAVAVFHADVSHILATWDGRPVPSRPAPAR